MDYNKKYFKAIHTIRHKNLYPSPGSSFEVKSPDQLKSPDGIKPFSPESPHITVEDLGYTSSTKNRKNPYIQSFRVNKKIK